MAFTTSNLVQTVMGNKRVVVIQVTADNTSGTVATGLGVIEAASVDAVSSPTAPVWAMNAGTTGTSILGTIGMSSTASGNVYQIIVYGH